MWALRVPFQPSCAPQLIEQVTLLVLLHLPSAEITDVHHYTQFMGTGHLTQGHRHELHPNPKCPFTKKLVNEQHK